MSKQWEWNPGSSKREAEELSIRPLALVENIQDVTEMCG
jgi:hypothetical protein